MSASSARTRLLAKFRSIAAERLERLSSTFVALESTPDDEEAIELILREIHSLKGEAKMMGFPKINEVAHKTEELLHHAKELRFQLPAASNDVFLGCNCPTKKNPILGRCHTYLALEFMQKKYPSLDVVIPGTSTED